MQLRHYFVKYRPNMTFAAGFLAVIWIALPALAADIPELLAPGMTVSSFPQFNDTSLTSNLITYAETPFGDGSAPSGIFLNFLSKSSVNPFGSDDYVFGYLISVADGDVVSVSLSGFAGFQTAVKIDDNGPGYVAPIDASRSTDGDTITFDFAGIPSGAVPTDGSLTFTPGNSTQTFSVYTDAPEFTDPPVTFIDSSGLSASIDTFGPAVAPEPSAFSLFAVGSLAAFFVRKRHS